MKHSLQWVRDNARAVKLASAKLCRTRAEAYEADARAHEAEAARSRAQADEERVKADAFEVASQYPDDLEPPAFQAARLMPMLATGKIRILDKHQRCVIELKDGSEWIAWDFSRDETVDIERALHEYNERQKP